MVLVAGATGHVGRAIVCRLNVVAVVREVRS
jgi:hypothetical protein